MYFQVIESQKATKVSCRFESTRNTRVHLESPFEVGLSLQKSPQVPGVTARILTFSLTSARFYSHWGRIKCIAHMLE